MENVYQAPEAELVKDEIGDFSVFERFSTWFVVVLSVITLSFYIPYWLYTRTKQLNTITKDKISDGFIITALALFMVSMAGAFASGSVEFSKDAEIVLGLLDLTSNIFTIVWVFKIRNRILDLVKDSPIDLGGVLTFFFQLYYLQYKINEIIDYKKQQQEAVQAQSV